MLLTEMTHCFPVSGEKRLASEKNNFEKGSEDKFTFEAPNLGKVRKITIGHNNRGASAGWFVDKVKFDNVYIIYSTYTVLVAMQYLYCVNAALHYCYFMNKFSIHKEKIISTNK